MAAGKDRQRRRERRADRRGAPASATPAGPTFAEVLAREQLVDQCTQVGRALIARAEALVADEARRTLRVISCHGCTAAKGCCTVTIMIWLYEAVPIAARLRDQGRDTAELRARLLESATRMESQPSRDYNRPCVFLDAGQRCTVYDVRPGDCGAAFVSSPPASCSDRDAPIMKFRDPIGDATESAELMFEQEAGLPPLDAPYMGALPRMVLLCLQAWDRPDYTDYLSRWVPVATARVLAAVKRRSDR